VHWSPVDSTCVITHVTNASAASIYIYSMAFDAIVLALNTFKLLKIGVVSKEATGSDAASKIGRIIFTDGLIYFIIAWVCAVLVLFMSLPTSVLFLSVRGEPRFLSNLLAAVFTILNLSEVMNVIFKIPASIITTVSHFLSSHTIRLLPYHLTEYSFTFDMPDINIPPRYVISSTAHTDRGIAGRAPTIKFWKTEFVSFHFATWRLQFID
jgi:hypothetical protein